MAVIAGTNLAILDNSTEASAGLVTLKNSSKINIESGVLAFDYALAAGKTDTGFAVTLKTIMNSSILLTDQFYFTQESAGAITKLSKTVSAAALSGKFFIEVPFPGPIKNVIVEIQWAGTFTTLSSLTVNFNPSTY